MPTALDDKVMNGFLISLGFHKPNYSEEISTPDKHFDLLPDQVMVRRAHKTQRDAYQNKRRVGLVRERTHEAGEVYVETLRFSKRSVEAGLTFATDGIRPYASPHSNMPELETSIREALERLPSQVKIQQKLGIIYGQLLDYKPPTSIAQSGK